jgi:hypothetical protein
LLRIRRIDSVANFKEEAEKYFCCTALALRKLALRELAFKGTRFLRELAFKGTCFLRELTFKELSLFAGLSATDYTCTSSV